MIKQSIEWLILRLRIASHKRKRVRSRCITLYVIHCEAHAHYRVIVASVGVVQATATYHRVYKEILAPNKYRSTTSQ